jgi:hypothetical protein
MAEKKKMMCYGCGSDITDSVKTRTSMTSSSFEVLVPTWKKFVLERLNELQPAAATTVDPDSVLSRLLCNGKVCRSCTSALHRLSKLEDSCRRQT